jgi:P-type Ca2+ transporter type 2C
MLVQPLHTRVRGRARFRVKGLYRSEPLKRYLESRLRAGEGLRSVSASALTGNILVYYNSGTSYHTIAILIEKAASEYKTLDPFHGREADTGGNNGRNHTTPPLQSTKKLPSLDVARSTPVSKLDDALTRRKLRRLVVHAEAQQEAEWHHLDIIDILRTFDVRKETGLSTNSVQDFFKKYGPNVLPESVPRSGLSILFGQIKSLPVALLGVAAGISLFTGGVADALVILGVVAINAAIGYTTESQAERTINSLKNLVRPSSLVMRDGGIKEIKSEAIVPGDLLILRQGSYVAADARLVEAKNLSVDESTLTGESFPVVKTTDPIPGGNVPLADRTNVVYMGTLITGGQGLAVVVATGRYTEIGKIQTLVGETKPPETPMEQQLEKIGTQLVIICSIVCGLVFLTGLLRGYGLLQMLKTSISLAVAAVPEGLPTVATTTLALGIRNMRMRNVLIRRLDAIETIGSVQTICLDKTGTLTMNRMSVLRLYPGMKRFIVSDGKFMDGDAPVNPYECDELLMLIHISVLCNESEVGEKEGRFIVNGSPTENALIHMALNAGINIASVRTAHPLLNVTHRAENRNYMYTLHESSDHGRIIALKGSPAEVLAMCDHYVREGHLLPLSDDNRTAIWAENEYMAGNALRVIGVAYCLFDGSGEDACSEKGLIWLGLIGMADPIRSGVKTLISTFHNAGINTVMITGDQSPTAFAIGRELNLVNGEQIEILDSTHLRDIDPELMKALCERVHVFSRVSPAHKLQIVQAFQAAGKVVAMTGDGINDGPALKAADIGITMGRSGTDVAREVSDIIVEDDNLETLIIAISQGRTIYNNIRKSVHFLLSTNLSEIMVMFTAIAAGLGQPLTAMQLLWINLISDIAPGLALAMEHQEPDVLSRPPRDPKEPIMRRSDFKRISFESAVMSAAALGAYGYGIMRYGMGQRASTIAFMSLSSAQLLHAISCRSEKYTIFDKERLPSNRYLTLALAASFGIQALAVVVPGLRGLLGIAPVDVLDMLMIAGSSVMPLLVNEGTKMKGQRGKEGEIKSDFPLPLWEKSDYVKYNSAVRTLRENS